MSDDESDVSLSLAGSESSEDDSVLSDDSSPPVKKTRTKKETPVKGTKGQKAQHVSSKPAAVGKIPQPKVQPQATAGKTSLQKGSSSSVPQPVEVDAAASSGDITRGAPVTTDIAAKKLIAQYLRQQNRPYSAIQIHDNLHKRVQKPTIERVLSSLCQPGGGFVCKEYGKAKIYFVDQETLPSDYSAQQLEELQDENEDLKKQVEGASSEDRALKSELQHALSEPTDEELVQQLQDARQRIAEKRQRVERLSSGASSSGAGGSGAAGPGKGPAQQKFSTLADAVLAHNQYRKAWQTRRAQCMEAVDLLAEGMGKKTKDVMAEMCLETDQDAGVQLPALLPEVG